MLGTDGIAERQSSMLSTALDPVDVLLAPGVGWQICVFSISLEATISGTITLAEGLGTVKWQALTYVRRHIFEFGDCGLFTLAENQKLVVTNDALAYIKLNLTYEIRPIGM